MSNLGTAYHLRFKNLGRLEDLEKSASCNAQAVDLTPEGHPDKPIYLRNQGDSYYSLFRRIGGPDDLRESIRCLERATQLTSNDHLYKPVFLMSLGAVYSDMFESSSLQEDASNALAALKHASLLSGGSPAIKLRASKMWAQLLARTGISPLDAYTRAMALVPQVVWLGVSMKDRYEGLSEDIQGLVSDATTAAVRLQCYDLAIEWLEQGRSIVWSQMMQLRTPLDTLHASHPAMAEKLRHISNELENLSIPSLGKQALSQDSASLHEVAQSHRRLAEKREELLDSIRSLDGFDDFLRPLSFNKLVQHVKNGVAVMINIHESDCDALIVQSGSVEVGHVLLSEFSVQKANDAHLDLTSYLHAEGIHRGIKCCHKDTNATFTSALRMLWSDVVHPVLEYLNITRVLPADDDNLPHITWCTTGILSFLPLHAAGDHTYPNKVLANLAVSSYAPTLGSLSRSGSPTDPFFGILAVGHESAIRGFSALPGTRAELDRVAASASGLPFTRLDGKKACVSSVLEAMMSHSWVHIACHGSQDPSDPMKSAFHLHDKDLDLATIARYPLKNARLAFLSACQTATGHATLPDESVHLAAGLLMSGYSTVIATMWSIHDQDAPLVAEKFYELLLKGGAVDSQQAANALHRAVASLREKIGVENYARWMPYIHLGC
ncbi:hypothetical protein FRC09_006564 [Ceratobasidium sp. 395]|nr:hypothetical protein FRC09_006564 [Ceratobasidium sp. 395]